MRNFGAGCSFIAVDGWFAVRLQEDEDDELMGETAVEQLLACPTL